jgi:hypothetical protein
MTLSVSYVISKNLQELSVLNAQDFNLANIDATVLDKVVTKFDAPQKFGALWTYELPFGKGKPFTAGASGILGKMIAGWRFNANVFVQSGFPIAFPNARNLEARSAKLPSSQRTLYNAFDKTLFPTSAPNLTYELRNFPSYFPDVRTMPIENVDFGLAKKTALTERVSLEFRSEFYNAFNHPWFSEINARGTDVTRAEFGWFRLEQRNAPRVVAFAAKLIW